METTIWLSLWTSEIALRGDQGVGKRSFSPDGLGVAITKKSTYDFGGEVLPFWRFQDVTASRV